MPWQLILDLELLIGLHHLQNDTSFVNELANCLRTRIELTSR